MPIRLIGCCLISIRNYLENGTIHDLSRLDSKLRERILDLVLMHGTITNPNCLTTLSNPKFLSDFSTLDLQNMGSGDYQYLDHLCNAMATFMPNGKSIGDGITDLKLPFYGFWIKDESDQEADHNAAEMGQQSDHGQYENDQMQSDQPISEPDQNKILASKGLDIVNHKIGFRLISQCPNLKCLSLDFIELRGISHDYQDIILKSNSDLLNKEAMDLCPAIFQNLQSLSLYGSPFFKIVSPMQELRNLRFLKLRQCDIRPDDWKKLEQSIAETVEIMELEINSAVDNIQLIILQTPYAKLKKLNVILDHLSADLNFENLNACPNLEELDLYLCTKHATNEAIEILNTLKAKVRISYYYEAVYDDSNLDLYVDRKFRVIQGLGEKITELRLCRFQWSTLFANALTHAVESCQNLDNLDLTTRLLDDDDEEEQLDRNGWESAMQSLISLFTDKDRSKKLRNLKFATDLDPAVLDLVFENCTNLEKLEIQNCPQLTDDHLLKWASRGAKPSALQIYDCENVTEDGVTPILINGCERFKKLGFQPNTKYGSSKVWMKLWKALANHCPHVQMVRGISVCSNALKKKFCNKFLTFNEFDELGIGRYAYRMLSASNE